MFISNLCCNRKSIPVEQRHQTPVSPTSEKTETEENDIHSTQEDDDDDEWMSDSSELVVESDTPKAPPTKPAIDQSDEEKKGKASPTAPGFDLDLGDVSEDSDWEVSVCLHNHPNMKHFVVRSAEKIKGGMTHFAKHCGGS